MSEISVVIPVYNEARSVSEVHRRVEKALSGIDWEIVFVDDDSTDGTTAEIRSLCRQDPRVRTLRRVGRRGLSSACVEGILSTTSDCFAVMDGDLQHDETKLKDMYDLLKGGDKDLVVGSRYVSGGGVGSWSPTRLKISRFATYLSKVVTRQDLSDPMSGFFAMRRSAFDQSLQKLSQQGFKILLDICASSPADLRIAEVPYKFGLREYGESKLDNRVAVEYLLLLFAKMTGIVVSTRFFLFCLIGTLGLLVHLVVLGTTLRLVGSFEIAQTAAVISAMTFNFFVNNLVTYRDRQLKGRALITGLLSFYVVCSLGALGNVGVGSLVYSLGRSWQLSGIAGAVVGAVWNYVASSFFTWGSRRKVVASTNS